MMCFALFLFILFVGSLLGFHVFLMLSNQTTWEVSSKEKITYLRRVPQNVYPFSKGPARDCAQFCCLPPPPGGYVMKPLRELRVWSKTETIWENKYYVCC
jgi:palmitoyltransferase